MTDSLLTIIIFFPLLIAGVILFLPNGKEMLIKEISLGATGVQLVLSIILFFSYDASLQPESWSNAFQFVERSKWISLYLGDYGWLQIDYFIGIDGISLLMICLSTLLLFIGVIASWNLGKNVKGYFILYLVLSASVIGCFAALDFFLFYVFFEFMLLPMFFLIGIWGGPRRGYASIKFFIYTLVGSLFILAVMIGLYLSVEDSSLAGQAGEIVHSFSLVNMMDGGYIENGILTPGTATEFWGMNIRWVAFILLMIGFAIKLPAVPVHTWLPDAHVEAPTAISVLLAGLLLKIGGYGFFRIAYGIFPDAAISLTYPIAIFGMISIVYGGLTAMAQNDLKRMIAYSSVSHMGFILLGLASFNVQGAGGALFQMVSHGFISGALFILAGVIYDRTGNRGIANFSGLAKAMPIFTGFVVVFFFASLGLPGLSGFVGEFLVFLGALGSDYLPKWIGIVSISGIVISAAYYLWALQRMFFGQFWTREKMWEHTMYDLTARELLLLIPLAILVVLLGVAPNIILGPVNNSVEFFVNQCFAQSQLYIAQ